MLWGQLIIWSPRTGGGLSVQDVRLVAAPDGNTAEVNVSSGRFADTPLLASLMPLVRTPINRPVFVFLDFAYPNPLSDARTWKGLFDHLQLNLQIAGFGGQVATVDGAHIRDVMESNPQAVVILPNGCTPDSIYDANFQWLHQWLGAGGTLVWLGDAFGYYHCQPGDQLRDLDPRVTAGWQPATNLFGTSLFEGKPSDRQRTLVPGPVNQALDVQYSIGNRGAIVPELRAMGGQPLGQIEAGSPSIRTTVAYIPVGSGGVIDFGWGLESDELTPAADIAHILASGYLDADHHIIPYTNDLAPAQSTTQMRLAVPPAATAGYLLSVSSRDPYIAWSSHQIIVPATRESSPRGEGAAPGARRN
jgi:hypothetical protein